MKTKLQLLFLILAMILQLGCQHSTAPYDNADFKDVKSLSELTGVYKNKGDLAYGLSPNKQFLSQLLWPNDSELIHEDILYIEVSQSGTDELLIKAHGLNGILKEAAFIHGKDFRLNDGRILLKSRMSLIQGESGGVHIGPWANSVSLGLDKRGNGKARHSESGVVLAYLAFPIAASGTDDVRFERISQTEWAKFTAHQ